MSMSTRLDETTVAHGTWTHFRTAWIRNIRVDICSQQASVLLLVCLLHWGALRVAFKARQFFFEESSLLCQSQCKKQTKLKSAAAYGMKALQCSTCSDNQVAKWVELPHVHYCSLSLPKEKSRDAEVKAQPWGQTPVASYCLAFPWFSIKQARRWLLPFFSFFLFLQTESLHCIIAIINILSTRVY